MDQSTIVSLREDELLTFVRRCFEWRNADVYAFGRHDSISRLGEIAGYISMMSDEDGNPRAESVKIVLPPAGGRDPQRMHDELREGVKRAFRRFEEDDTKTAPFVDATIAKLEVEQTTDFTMASLTALLSAAESHQAVIVGEAGHYRSSEVVVTGEGPHMPEDVWCAHLHGVMMMAEGQARARQLRHSGHRGIFALAGIQHRAT